MRATMELQALERVRADGGGYALALPGKDGRALHARSQDKQHRAQLVGRIAKRWHHGGGAARSRARASRSGRASKERPHHKAGTVAAEEAGCL